MTLLITCMIKKTDRQIRQTKQTDRMRIHIYIHPRIVYTYIHTYTYYRTCACIYINSHSLNNTNTERYKKIDVVLHFDLHFFNEGASTCMFTLVIFNIHQHWGAYYTVPWRIKTCWLQLMDVQIDLHFTVFTTGRSPLLLVQFTNDDIRSLSITFIPV